MNGLKQCWIQFSLIKSARSFMIYCFKLHYLDTPMNRIKIPWICMVIFILVILTSSQKAQTQQPPTPLSQKKKQLLDLKDENLAVIHDGTAALKELTEQHKKVVSQGIEQAANAIKEAANATHDILPSLSALLTTVLNTVNDYKKEAAGGIAGLITAFQMIFGGGVSYLTSKMKNLSKHKQLIEQGFDLQFRMFQKQEMKVIKTIDPSPSFKQLFDFLDHRSKKLVKVVIGTNGMGFTTNLQEWVKRQNQRDKYHHCIYYDMSEPPIRFNSAQENTHMDCISAIVYSLLHRQDRNFLLFVFKGITGNVFEFLMNIANAVLNHPILAIAYLSSFVYLRQIFYLATLYFIVQNFVLPVLYTIFSWLGSIESTIEEILTNKARKPKPANFKIVIDNFHVLKSEFEERFKAGKLKEVINGIENPNQPLPVSTPDNSTYEQHKEYFEQNLTSLFNNIVALQKSGDTAQEAQIIIFIHNSEFYKQYLENLRLNSPNPFKVKRFSQLPAKDTLHILKQCTPARVNISTSQPQLEKEMDQDKGFFKRCIQSVLSYVGLNKNEKQLIQQDKEEKQQIEFASEAGIEMTKFLRLFHNNSKVVVRILKEVSLDTKHFLQQGSPKFKKHEGKLNVYRTKYENIAEIIRTSMAQILVHAQYLEQLVSIENDNNPATRQKSKKNKQKPSGEGLPEDSYLRYVGLFLGCVHKQLLFFASRSEGVQDNTFKSDFAELMKIINDPKHYQLDMLSAMSIGNRHYLFQKQGGIISLRTDAEAMMMKWDNLIDYIRGDNNWEDSLREDFVYYYTENRILMERLKKTDHQALHQHLKEWLKKPDQAKNSGSNLGPNGGQSKVPSITKRSMSNMNERIFSRPGEEFSLYDEGETIKKHIFDAQGRKIFDEIVNFLTQKDIISEHIFFSRSMALANYYMQEKVKEKVLYQKFQMSKCQLATTIQIIAAFRKQNQSNHKFFHEFAKKIHIQLQQFIKHEANSFEQGMAWLKWYYPTIPNCDIGDSIIEMANKYLLRRTNNCYVLKPSINNVLLYWAAFYPKLDLQWLEQYLFENNIAINQAQLKDCTDFLKASTTVCAYWLFQCKTKEESISRQLLGCQCKDLAIAVEGLQSLQCEMSKQSHILTIKEKIVKNKLKTQLCEVYSHFLTAFGLHQSEKHNQEVKEEPYNSNEISQGFVQKLNSHSFRTLMDQKVKQVEFDDVNELLFEYRELLKTYQPDGLFKQLRNKYQKCLYLFQHCRSYTLSRHFRHLLMAFHYVRKAFLNNQPINQNKVIPIQNGNQPLRQAQEETSKADSLAQKLAFTKQQLGDFYKGLKRQEWVLLMKYGQRVKEKLRSLLKDEKPKIRLQLREATLLVDLKAQLAAFCFTS